MGCFAGPNVLNMALQYVSDAIPVDVIPTKWIYPSSMTTTQDLVMFGHSKDRSVHANNNLGSTVRIVGLVPWMPGGSAALMYLWVREFSSRLLGLGDPHYVLCTC